MACESCPIGPGLDCLGSLGPEVCARIGTDAEFRAMAIRRAEILAAWPFIQVCPDRGPVLPVSRQADCGCQGKELTLCRAGKGPPHRPDAVTLDECTACVSATAD
jgi:hypothetical protein